MSRYKRILFLFLLLFQFIQPLEVVAALCVKGPHTFYLGPELYYSRRTRNGGTMDGMMYGAYASYERLRRSAFYWAVDYSVAYGAMTGHAASKAKQKFWLLDENVEGRIGYTFSTKRWKQPYFTPFVGYGYFYQTNRYVDPTELKVTFRDTFPFASVGFLTGMKFTPHLALGVLFRAKWMVDGRHRVTNDPDFDTSRATIEEKWQYEVEFPIDYVRCQELRSFNFRVTPFFRFRHYGEKAAYPFNFVETKYTNYGIRLLASYAF